MHSKNYLHRDLKSLNLLVDRNYNIKIADFGESRDINSLLSLTKGIGTYLWMAPEVSDLRD
jgi:serine/threonine protein kinase